MFKLTNTTKSQDCTVMKKHNPSLLGIYIYIYIYPDVYMYICIYMYIYIFTSYMYMKPTAYHIMVQPLQAHCHGKYDNSDKG